MSPKRVPVHATPRLPRFGAPTASERLTAMSEGRRYPFEDAINRRARELERALEVQRKVIRNEGQ
jgi:hypothetical protein